MATDLVTKPKALYKIRVTLLPLELVAEGVTDWLGISPFLFFMLAFCFFLIRKDLGILMKLS